MTAASKATSAARIGRAALIDALGFATSEIAVTP